MADGKTSDGVPIWRVAGAMPYTKVAKTVERRKSIKEYSIKKKVKHDVTIEQALKKGATRARARGKLKKENANKSYFFYKKKQPRKTKKTRSKNHNNNKEKNRKEAKQKGRGNMNMNTRRTCLALFVIRLLIPAVKTLLLAYLVREEKPPKWEKYKELKDRNTPKGQYERCCKIKNKRNKLFATYVVVLKKSERRSTDGNERARNCSQVANSRRPIAGAGA